MDFTTESNRIFAEDPTGKIIAEITFPVKDKVATIDHTFVDESLRGHGIAGKLMEAAAAKILSEGNKIAATCSYAAAWLEKHPEIPHENIETPVACKIDGGH